MPANEVTANGNTYTSGASAGGKLGMASGGFRDNLLPMLGDVMTEVDAVRGAGATSSTSFDVSASLPATQAFTIAVSATYRVGTLMFGWSKADPTKWIYGTMSASSGTSLTLVIAYANGSGAVTDWILAAYVKSVRTQVPKAANFSVTVDDFDKVFICSASLTASLAAVSALGIGWRARFVNSSETDDVTVDPDTGDTLDFGAAGAAIVLKPGQTIEVEAVAAAALRVTAAKGFGSTPPLQVDGTVRTGNFTMQPGYTYRVDTTAGAITATIAAGAADGALFGIIDHARTFGTNACTIDANTTAGDTIRGANTYALNVSGLGASFARTHATTSWGMI
jgi:hypothetical protein